LGEISPNEFQFYWEDIRLDPLWWIKNTSVEQLLSFYMGKNTPDRQEFIIKNLKVDLDVIEEAFK
jgi:topoisomerase-4 subunit B